MAVCFHRVAARDLGNIQMFRREVGLRVKDGHEGYEILLTHTDGSFDHAKKAFFSSGTFVIQRGEDGPPSSRQAQYEDLQTVGADGVRRTLANVCVYSRENIAEIHRAMNPFLTSVIQRTVASYLGFSQPVWEGAIATKSPIIWEGSLTDIFLGDIPREIFCRPLRSRKSNMMTALCGYPMYVTDNSVINDGPSGLVIEVTEYAPFWRTTCYAKAHMFLRETYSGKEQVLRLKNDGDEHEVDPECTEDELDPKYIQGNQCSVDFPPRIRVYPVEKQIGQFEEAIGFLPADLQRIVIEYLRRGHCDFRS